MTKSFISEDFLLDSKTARTLYHQYAEKMPIYDYHCHLPADDMAADRRFDNLSQIWLYGDHYKWRAMRANGIDEKYCSGGAEDYEKFEKWAQTVPKCLRNPLYHWTHLELKRYFGIDDLLTAENARRIYDRTAEMLGSAEFGVRNLLRRMNVRLVCTTESPLSSLAAHKAIRQEGFGVKVYAAFRPDCALLPPESSGFGSWLQRLEEASDTAVSVFDSYIEALRKRHDYFHKNGCRLSDYGLETAYAAEYTHGEVEKIFDKVRAGHRPEEAERLKFNSAVLYELAAMDAEAGWVMQLHLGALRNVNSRMAELLGADCGCDCIGDFEVAGPLAKFLDRLDSAGKLPKTILYNLNPKDSASLVTIAGSFQDGSCPGKIQYGPAWWFLDQKEGMEEHLDVLSNMGLLSRFVGMVTDSRSFLSFPRHEYFRRILCNVLGRDVERGLLPADMELLGRVVEDICYNNARDYFDMEVD